MVNQKLIKSKIPLMLAIINTINIVIICIKFNYTLYGFFLIFQITYINYIITALAVLSFILYIFWKPNFYTIYVRVLGVINGMFYMIYFILVASFFSISSYSFIFCIVLSLLLLVTIVFVFLKTEFYTIQLLLLMITMLILTVNRGIDNIINLIILIVSITLICYSIGCLIYYSIKGSNPINKQKL